MKKFLLLISLSVLFFSVLAQPMGSGVLTWMPDGNSYLSIEKNSMVRTALPAFSKTVLYDWDKVMPKEESHPRSISSFTLSKDLKQVILKINTKTQYHKITGEV